MALALALTWTNARWVALNGAPPKSDDNMHLDASIQLFRETRPIQSVTWAGHYPPLVYQCTAGFYRLLGVGPRTAIASFLPFLLVLGFSMYGIGRRWGDRAVGLGCAVVTLGSPLVLEYGRRYFLDLPSTAMLAASVCCLVYSDGFRVRAWSVGFGLSVGLGLLTKWTLPLFLFPILAVEGFRALRPMGMAGLAIAALLGNVALLGVLSALTSGRLSWTAWGLVSLTSVGFCALLPRTGREGPAANLLEAFALAAVLASPWYVTNGLRVRERLLGQSGVPLDLARSLMAAATDLSVMVYLAPFLLGCGLVVGFARPALRRPTLILAASASTGVGWMSLLPPDSRYVLPTIVFVAPLCLLWTTRLRAVQIGLFPVLALACAAQSAAFLTALEFPSRIQLLRPTLALAAPSAPETGSYPYRAVIAALGGDRQLGFIESADDAVVLQPRSFLYPAALEGISLNTVETGEFLARGVDPPGIASVSNFLLIYRSSTARKNLLEAAARRGWILPGARPVARFFFSPSFQVELYRRSRSRVTSSTGE